MESTQTAAAKISNEIILCSTKEKKPFSPLALLKNEYFLNAVSLVAFFGLWHWAASSHVLGHSSSLAGPYDVVKRLYELCTTTLAGLTIWEHIWASVNRVLIGFVLAAVVGVPLGLMSALNRYVNGVVQPVFDLLKPMPPLAWISVSILWFGVGDAPKIFIIFIGAVVPAMLNAYKSVVLIEPELYDVVRVLGGNRWDEIKLVSFPGSLPAISAGLQIALSSAWTCVLAAELVCSRSGLGFIIIQGMKLCDPAMVIGGMIIIAVVAYAFTWCMSWLDRKMCPWRRSLEGF